MKEYLTIGLIQPTFKYKTAWGPKDGPYNLNMNKLVSESIWKQIKEAIKNLVKNANMPNIILIPELHVANIFIKKLEGFSKSYGIMFIVGVDFQMTSTTKKLISNTARVIIPSNWPNRHGNLTSKTISYGKTNFSYMEKIRFKNQSIGKCKEDPEPNMYILKTKEFGNIGLMICSDFFDIERYIIYQGRIHHLFLISLNKDLNTYFHLAQSLTRLLYANIVVCNSGVFGGSVVHSPYSDPVKRTIYKYEGQGMFNYQAVKIPVKELARAQNFDFTLDKKKNNIEFKASPPGYEVKDFEEFDDFPF